jgi:RHS repeat-associated protein
VSTRKTRAGDTISFAYDTLNRLITKTPPSPAAVVSYRYDLAGRLTGVSDTSAAIASAVPPSGTSVQYATSAAYDALNRPTGISWNPAPTAAGASASGVTFNHAYNQANQRIGQTATDNSWFNYPAATPSTVSYTANALNQYTAVGAVTPTYNGNGSLTSDGTFTLGYDAENRLTSASGAGNTASYTYDAQGRRKTKTVNGATTVFVTDAGNREVLEYDGASGAILRWYAYGLGSNDVLNQMNVAAATRATFIPDLQGSVIGSLDSTLGALSKIGYLPYGKSASATGPFGYTGQRVDPETNGLYYYRARHYSPAWGRFLQPDPIGYSGGSNLYAYVRNDPLNATDMSGLWSLDLNFVIVGFSVGIGEKSAQPFGTIRGGLVGAGLSYDPSTDIPLGASGQFPGNCALCSISRVYWETIKGGLGVIAGPVNVSVVKVEGSTLVNEYNGYGTIVSSSVTPGNGISIDPTVSAAGAKGFKADLSYYYEIGSSFSWDSVRNAVSSSAVPPAPSPTGTDSFGNSVPVPTGSK